MSPDRSVNHVSRLSPAAQLAQPPSRPPPSARRRPAPSAQRLVKCPLPMLTINEIFHSIQGESTYAGRPCVFVRLTACDLRCSWCDTPYAFHEGRKMALDDVLAEVDALRLSAGRGHRRRAAAAGRRLSADGRLLDTRQDRAARDRRPSQHRDVSAGAWSRIMDVKCPGSGEAEEWTGRTSSGCDRTTR